MKIMAASSFNIFYFGIGLIPIIDHLEDNISKPPKAFKRYGIRIIIWPLALAIWVESGENPFHRMEEREIV